MINEDLARAAKHMNSFNDYIEGSATDEYNSICEKARVIAERCKANVDEMYHEKIDKLLALYERKLENNINKRNEIDSRYPSIMISGGGNFDNRKKEKQNAARDNNMRERIEIDTILDKIQSVGSGGISSDDPDAVEKLEKKLAELVKLQEEMKAINSFYRKNKTLDGCECSKLLLSEARKNLKRYSYCDKPFETYELSNNSARIRHTKQRLETLKKAKEKTSGILFIFDNGRVEAHTEDNRLRIFFDDIPNTETRQYLKANAFKWSPKAQAWQRQLTNNAIWAAKNLLFKEV